MDAFDQARSARGWTAASDGDGAQRFGLSSSPYSGLFVVAKGLDRVARVRAQITDIGFATSAPESLIAQFQRYRHVVEIVLGGIGLIALVIAALGICNALLAAVRERTREIGVLKAIGARDRDVLRVFLVEATALGLVGGVIGAVSGWAVARAVGAVVNRYLTAQGLSGVTVGLPVLVLVACVAGAVALALLAGAAPALRAARLPAREAVGEQ
jgi:ABC-type antimicrobial peptide transport system permease subunit